MKWVTDIPWKEHTGRSALKYPPVLVGGRFKRVGDAVWFLGQEVPFPWRRDRLPTLLFLGFPGGSDGKESACNEGDLGSIAGLGRSPGGGHGNPVQYSCLENPHGQRSLGGYSPWDCKESKHSTHTYSWLILLYSRNQHNIVKQLNVNNNIFKKSILLKSFWLLAFVLRNSKCPTIIFKHNWHHGWTHGGCWGDGYDDTADSKG